LGQVPGPLQHQRVIPLAIGQPQFPIRKLHS
jgi:hypothetical protein